MKCAIIYFSSTGITPKFAKEIAKGINCKNDWQFTYLRVKKGIKIDLTGFDLVGIGAPCYSFRAPRLMTRILQKINFRKIPFFVFATYNTMAGNTLWNLYKAARKTAGMCLGYIQGSITVNIRAWNPKIGAKEKGNVKEMNDITKQKAKKFGEEIKKRFQEIKRKTITEQNKTWIPRRKIRVSIWCWFLTWDWQMMLTVGFKRIDKERCTKCNLCIAKICPSKAIIIGEEDYPKFLERNCVGCNGCVNLCPEDAIYSRKTKKKLPYNLYKDYILNNEL